MFAYRQFQTRIYVEQVVYFTVVYQFIFTGKIDESFIEDEPFEHQAEFVGIEVLVIADIIERVSGDDDEVTLSSGETQIECVAGCIRFIVQDKREVETSVEIGASQAHAEVRVILDR